MRHLSHLSDLVVQMFVAGEQDMSALAHARHLTGLTFANAGEISLRPLEAHPGIERLVVDTRARFHDLDIITGLTRLSTLVLVQDEPIEDFTFLARHPSIRTLRLSMGRPGADYRPLASIESLTSLHLSDLDQSSCLLPLSTHGALRTLSLSTTDIPGLAEVLPEFRGLQELRVDLDSPHDVEPLRNLLITDLLMSRIASPLTLAPLRSLASLSELTIFDAADLDLAPLADLDLRLKLDRRSTYRGLDRLGSGVRVTWLR
ncbi:hypothetical protein [Saccharopolyspora sp. CA-218241]|uniref:hypothetical protein n=1 Tax=Saccharopolyspora sp. CA-218241 TaxID=3240027 RepID=UPI003D95FF61